MSFVRLKQSVWAALRLPRCNRLTHLISQSLDRKLSIRDHLILELHFIGCPKCARYQKQLQVIQKLLASKSPKSVPLEMSISLAPETKERLKQMLASRSGEDATNA